MYRKNIIKTFVSGILKFTKKKRLAKKYRETIDKEALTLINIYELIVESAKQSAKSQELHSWF